MALLVVLALPIVELVLMIAVGRSIGGLYTIGLLFAAGLLGVLVIKLAGWRVVRRARGALGRGKLPGQELQQAHREHCPSRADQRRHHEGQRVERVEHLAAQRHGHHRDRQSDEHQLDGVPDHAAEPVAADLTRASLIEARFDGANLSADMRNQSMGLMRGVMRSARLDRASFANANLARVALEFASLRGANLRGARLSGAELAGADLEGADVTDADFENADVTSARLLGLQGRSQARNLKGLKTLDRAIVD